MVEVLRDKPGTGMVSGVSGMLTKQSWGLWSTEPGTLFKHIDVTPEVRKVQCDKEVSADYRGAGVICGYTVLYHKGEPARAVAVIDVQDGRRCVSYNEDSSLMALMQTEEYVGRTVQIEDGRFY